MSTRQRFGRIEIRPDERRLLVDGRPAALGARAFDVLLALVERRERVVTKNELLDLAWPGLVVEENNLQVQVSALRKALGAQAIATVPGRGYRFVLPADDAAAPAAAPTVPDPPSAPVTPSAAATPFAAPPSSPATPSTAAPASTPVAPAASVGALPAPPVHLLGRDDELAALDGLLRRHRVVTVLGAGGIGKTTLALAAAHAGRDAHADGAAWIELAAISDAAAVPAAVAQGLQLALGAGDPLDALVAALRPLRVLVVVDNAEHLVDAVAELARALVAGAAGVRLLVTSQAPLRIDGERVFRLGPLALPDAPVRADEALAFGAVALFVDQAQAADRRFALTDANVDTVVQLCRQLDGVALAIKLAAARVPLLGLQGLQARLSERFRLLGTGVRGAPAHQRTLRAALDWSHGLLSEPEQRVFRRLGVFAGGFALESAAAVARDDALDEWAVIDALGALADRSLVAVDGGDAPRYRLLESAREYAQLKLDEAGERHAVQQRHLRAIAARMELADQALRTLPDAPWLAAYGPEIDNVRAALDWGGRHDPPLAVALAGASAYLFMLLRLRQEARRRFELLEPQLRPSIPTQVAARYWTMRAVLQIGMPTGPLLRFAQRAAALHRETGDARGLYVALSVAAGSSALPAAESWRMLDEMRRLEQPDWSPRLRRQRKWAEAAVLKSEGRLAEFLAAVEEGLALAEAAGAANSVAAFRSWLVEAHLALDEVDRAVDLGRELLRSNGVWHSVGLPAMVANGLLMQGKVREAEPYVAEFIDVSRSRGWEWFGYHSDTFALLAACQGRAETAARLIGYCDRAHLRLGGRNANDARARALAHAAIARVLEPRVVERLMAEGARMHEPAVCALVLGRADPPDRAGSA